MLLYFLIWGRCSSLQQSTIMKVLIKEEDAYNKNGGERRRVGMMMGFLQYVGN